MTTILFNDFNHLVNRYFITVDLNAIKVKCNQSLVEKTIKKAN